MSEQFKKPTRSPLDVARVRAAMAQRGWRVSDLAEKCGVTSGSLNVYLSKGLPDDFFRRKLERGFDYEIDLGCGERMLDFRRRVFAALGFDPALESKESLQQRCEQLGVRDFKSGDRTTAGLIEKLQSHFAANPRILMQGANSQTHIIKHEVSK